MKNLQIKKLFLSIGITSIAGWAFTFLAIHIFRDYAFGLFVWLPFIMGATATLLFSYKNPTGRKALRDAAYGSLFVYCLGLLFFAWEGVICLIMAAPIGLLFTWLGYRFGWYLLNRKRNNIPASVSLLLISVPFFMSFENVVGETETLRSVTTSIEISATPEAVWKNVISFPQLREPNEFIFKTGISYPVNATISGHGAGAIRYCNFSTGKFVEPITVWDEQKLLQFSVLEQPEPMKELSFYDIHPNHLHGYWISKKGQFKLTSLPNGHTLLEGTTWYVNKIKPGLYWTLWSDYIVHKIHNRVLQHIKENAELISK